MWDYFGLQGRYNISLEEYAMQKKKLDRKGISIGRNQILNDFGMIPKDFDSPTAVSSKIAEIDDMFDLGK